MFDCIGGSYPGTLAALARSEYPHFIHAAVSSSAPLEPAVDFPGYLEVVGSDLHYEKIGGSDECYKAVQDGHTDISDALIGVHCTHGVNRTGYLICRYLIEKMDWDPQKAIDGKVY